MITDVMGILNVTPDSFSDGGHFRKLDEALYHTEEMLRDGATIIDVGGESTRPDAPAVPMQEEIERVTPVIEAIKSRFDTVISLDTYKAGTAAAGIAAGAEIINDIGGLLLDGGMGQVIKETGVMYVLTHNMGETEREDLLRSLHNFDKKADSRTSLHNAQNEFKNNNSYLNQDFINKNLFRHEDGQLKAETLEIETSYCADNIIKTTVNPRLDTELENNKLWKLNNNCNAIQTEKDLNYVNCMLYEAGLLLEYADSFGIGRDHILWDPGIGFHKTVEQNLAILRHLDRLQELSLPVLLGTSRKSVIGAVLGTPVTERLEGTLATTAMAVFNGVRYVRVHDVKENVRLIKMLEAMQQS